jgi:hypothetical protein
MAGLAQLPVSVLARTLPLAAVGAVLLAEAGPILADHRPLRGHRHRFPLLKYSSIMTVIAAPTALRSTYPASLAILVVAVVLAVLVTAGYFIGRQYVNRRLNRRNSN